MISGDALRTEHWMDNDLQGGIYRMPSILSLGKQFVMSVPLFMGVLELWNCHAVNGPGYNWTGRPSMALQIVPPPDFRRVITQNPPLLQMVSSLFLATIISTFCFSSWPSNVKLIESRQIISNPTSLSPASMEQYAATLSHA